MLTPEEIEAIKSRLDAAKKSDDWGKHGIQLTFTPEKPGHPAALWYGDGDQAAQIHGNLGLGIDGDAIGRFFEKAIQDVDALLGMISEKCCKDPSCHACKTFAQAVEMMVKSAVLKERERCAKIAERHENDSELGEFGTCSQMIRKG